MLIICCLVAIPVHAVEVQNFTEAIALSNTIHTEVMAGNSADLVANTQALNNFVVASSLYNPDDDGVSQDITAMINYVSGNSASTTLTGFLLHNNAIQEALLEAQYQAGENPQGKPIELYEMRRLAQNIQIEVLEKDWRSLERNSAEDFYGAYAQVRPGISNATLLAQMDGARGVLGEGIDFKDELVVYQSAQLILDTIDAAEADYQAPVDITDISTFPVWPIVAGLLLLVGVGVYFFVRKKRDNLAS